MDAEDAGRNACGKPVENRPLMDAERSLNRGVTHTPHTPLRSALGGRCLRGVGAESAR
jgi:hypothetical protein